MINKNKDRGITLVALVITIIILLILATISIQSLTNTGLFQKAQEAKEKTLILLKEAVQKRIPKEVQWTSHLSGGIDSSIISYLSHQEHEDRTCFTIQFTDDSFYDESALAIETAKKINAKLEIIPMSFGEILKNIPNQPHQNKVVS